MPVGDKLLATLKRHNPHKVRSFVGDDDSRDIAVPTRRRKWSQVIEAIESRAWTRVELLDKSGALLASVDNEGPAGGLEDIELGRTGGQVLLAERMVAMCIKAQRDAMTFRDAEVTALLRAQGDVVREMTAGMRALTAMYQEQVDVAQTLAENRTLAAAGPEKDQLTQLLEAAPLMMQAMPMLRALLSGEPPSVSTVVKPKNGA